MNLLSKPAPDFPALAARIPVGGHIVMHSDFAEPAALSQRLAEHAALFKGVNLHTLMAMEEPPYAQGDAVSQLNVQTFFPGSGLRRAVNQGLVQARRCALSEIPTFFSRGEIKANMLLLQVSSANEKGQVSLGLSVDYMREVLAQKPIVVVQLNANMPFIYGDTLVDAADIDYVLPHDQALIAFPSAQADPIDDAIARHVVSLISDGDVIQAGIGALPDAVIANLGHLKHLGVHTGILTSAWQALIESGVVDNSTKKQFHGKTIATMAGGDERFYEFLNHNETIELYSCALTHRYETLAAIDNLCAVNSVLQIDLKGDANAESVNGRLISTPGGLPDFARGASGSQGGKSIIALRSSFKKGTVSNIVSKLADDVPRSLEAGTIGYVVTEYGIATLHDGLDKKARAQALINIAHPDHREALTASL